MARRSQEENRPKNNHAVLDGANRILPGEENLAPPIVRIRIPKQGDEGGYGKDIEKQPIESIFVSERTLEEIRNCYGNQGTMNNAVGNP